MVVAVHGSSTAARANLDEAAAGIMLQEDADNLLERLAPRIDDIIDGDVPSGGREPAPIGR